MECVEIFCATLQTFWRHKQGRRYEHEWRLVEFLIAEKYDHWVRITFITDQARGRLTYRTTRLIYMQDIQDSNNGCGIDHIDWNISWHSSVLQHFDRPCPLLNLFTVQRTWPNIVCPQVTRACPSQPIQTCNMSFKLMSVETKFSYTHGAISQDAIAWGQL
jgi:hypothetical protein